MTVALNDLAFFCVSHFSPRLLTIHISQVYFVCGVGELNPQGPGDPSVLKTDVFTLSPTPHRFIEEVGALGFGRRGVPTFFSRC